MDNDLPTIAIGEGQAICNRKKYYLPVTAKIIMNKTEGLLAHF